MPFVENKVRDRKHKNKYIKTKVNEIDYYLKRAPNTGEEINAVAWSEYRGLGNISIPDSSDKVKLITEEMVAKKI